MELLESVLVHHALAEEVDGFLLAEVGAVPEAFSAKNGTEDLLELSKARKFGTASARITICIS